jgi:hypothetical protein
MPMKHKPISTLLLAFLLAACSLRPSAPRPAPTETASAAATPGLPRWRYWERALGDILNGPVGNTRPDLSQDHGKCEWDIWGQNGKDVYVWALCKVYHAGTGTTATSAPAIVRLGEDDEIRAVIMPSEGWGNLDSLFPPDVVEKIERGEFDVGKAETDIALRIANPSLPPLIIRHGVLLP